MSKWIKNYIVNRMGDVDPIVAAEWKTKLSALYFLMGWNLFGYTVYSYWKKSYPNLRSASDYAQFLGVNDAKVVNVQGLSISDPYNISFNDSEIENFHKNSGEKQATVD